MKQTVLQWNYFYYNKAKAISMQYPTIYLATEFLDSLNDFSKLLTNFNVLDIENNNENKLTSFQRIRDLILSSNVYSNVKDKELIKYFTKDNSSYSNIKHLIYHQLIKNSTHTSIIKFQKNVDESSCLKSNICYLTNKDYEIAKEESAHKGKIILGKDFLQDDFFLTQSFATVTTNASLSQVNDFIHPCRSLIVIDGYIFSNGGNKIPNFITFLKTLIDDNLTDKFELDIITNNLDNNSKLITDKLDEINRAFDNKLSTHIYATPKKIGEADRYFITNYGVMTVGHPFDRESNVSAHFFPSTINKKSIIASYKLWVEKVEFAKQKINDTPNNFGLVQTKWKPDEIEHCIFDY